MYIRSLRVSDCRIISSVKIELSPSFNLITGENGSGKSTILESIYLLGTGRSFRSPSPSTLIKHGEKQLIISAEVESLSGTQFSIGIERGKKYSRLHINRTPTMRLSEVAELLPMQIITPDSINLVMGSPRERRSFLDWGMFHVEPKFLPVVKEYKKALKHRNSLLKRKTTTSQELSYWNRLLADGGEKIGAYRERYLDEVEDIYRKKIYSTLKNLHDLDISFKYRQGWGESTTLLGAFEEGADRERAAGRTLSGPHEADLFVGCGNVKAKTVLSRGQAKLLSIGLYLSQLYHLYEKTGKKGVVLLDDLFSELDHKNGVLVLDYLISSGYQVFATTTEVDHTLFSGGSVEMFHVEHGHVCPVSI